MKKTLLLLVFGMLGLMCPILGQIPWARLPNSPVYSQGNASSGGVQYMTSPQPGVLWVLVRESESRGSGGRDTYRNRLVSTADEGTTWQELPATVQAQLGGGTNNGVYDAFTTFLYEKEILDASAVDAQNAWLLTPNTKLSTLKEVSLFRTTSGPNGFVSVVHTLPAPFRRIHFFTAITGIAVAEVPGATTWSIYRTTDAGLTWTVVPNTPMHGKESALAYSKQSYQSSLWMTTNAGTLLHTHDAGLTWSSIPEVGDVSFTDALHGLSYSQRGLKLRQTDDGGQTWTDIAYNGTPGFVAMTTILGSPNTYLSSDFTYPGADNNAIIRTSISYDRGKNWQELDATSRGGAVRHLVAITPTTILAGVATAFREGANEPIIKRYNGTVLALPTWAPRSTSQPLRAYPNPTTGLLQLEGELSRQEEVRVYDATGRLRQVSTVSASQRLLNLAVHPSGLYELVCTGADGTIRRLRVSKL